ncbi:unnamed protein product [marine sediment metagenome]|uniref:Uncharacterized protein n=1 Tax=marine sediment metagenome TaxID=412755 RepID=X0T126_9ZZZZ
MSRQFSAVQLAGEGCQLAASEALDERFQSITIRAITSKGHDGEGSKFGLLENRQCFHKVLETLFW